MRLAGSKSLQLRCQRKASRIYAMPRIRISDPAVLQRKAHGKLLRGLQVQRRQKIPLLATDQLQNQGRTPENTANEKDGEPRKSIDASTSMKQPMELQDCPKNSKNSSKVLEMMKDNPTYCLTGSKLFWQTDDHETRTGTWRP